MSVIATQEVEVVSILALNDKTVRLGLARKGRIHEHSQRAQGPDHLGGVGVDVNLEWPSTAPVHIGQILTVSYSVKG